MRDSDEQCSCFPVRPCFGAAGADVVRTGSSRDCPACTSRLPPCAILSDSSIVSFETNVMINRWDGSHGNSRIGWSSGFVFCRDSAPLDSE